MKIGVMDHPARNPLEEIEWIGKNGFDFVDFTLEPPAADPDQIDAAAVRTALARHRLGVVAHTAYYLPFGTPFASIRVACSSEFRRALRVAHEIGATVMNVHYSKAPGFLSKEQVIEWHVEVLGRLVSRQFVGRLLTACRVLGLARPHTLIISHGRHT